MFEFIYFSTSNYKLPLFVKDYIEKRFKKKALDAFNKLNPVFVV